jgi:hypothetical protein
MMMMSPIAYKHVLELCLEPNVIGSCYRYDPFLVTIACHAWREMRKAGYPFRYDVIGSFVES